MALHRQQSRFPIPASEPTFQQHKDGSKASSETTTQETGRQNFDKEIHPDIQREILGIS